jgi:hypothetical protein
MTALSVKPPFPVITDTAGQPLEDGFIYIGIANQDPVTNPITVYWDAALTIPASQPIRTLAGYPSRAGTPAVLYVNSNYSITVKNKNNALVYQSLSTTERYGGVVFASDVLYDPAGSNAVQRTVESKLRESVSVKDFGAVGNGIADDTVAIQNAFDYASANNKSVYVPAGTYNIISAITINTPVFNRFSIFGSGGDTTINQITPNEHCIYRPSGNIRITIENISFNCVSGTGKAIYIFGAFSSSIKNVTTLGGAEGIYLPKIFSASLENVRSSSHTEDAFYIEGLITCTLINCYAATLFTAGKSGYVIDGSAELIGCNGCDVSGSGSRAANIVRVIGTTSRVVLTNCNFEDYGDYGIRFDSGSINAKVSSCTFIPGTSTTDIAPVFFVSMQGTPPIFDNNNFLTASGSAGAAFVSNTDNFNIVPIVIGASNVTALTVKGPTLTYNVASCTVESVAFLKYGTKFDHLTCNRFMGFIAPAAATWTVNATSYNVAGKNLVRTANTSATNLNAATGATIEGHRLTIMVNDANTTIKHNVGGAGRFINSSGADIVAPIGKVYEYVYHNFVWWQVG